MGFWTNYDSLTGDQGYKSIVPNVNGYVVPAGDAFGDMLLHIKALLVASGNFVSIAGNAESGNKSSAQYEVVAWAGTNNQQQIIFPGYSGYINDFSFRSVIGSISPNNIAFAGRDIGHTPSPDLFNALGSSSSGSDEFFAHIDYDGSDMSYSSVDTTQDINIWVWTSDNICTFLLNYSVWGAYRSNILFFRLPEPIDGHYTRTIGGATHGAIRTYSFVENCYLAGVSGDYTIKSNVGTTLGGRWEKWQETPDGKYILRQLTVAHSAYIGMFLGAIPGFYVSEPDVGVNVFDTCIINDKEYVCIQGGDRPALFVQNEPL